NVDKALQLKQGKPVNINNVLSFDKVFYDSKKGLHASSADLESAFGTSNTAAIAEKIIKQGEIQVPKEYKDKEREDKKKQIIDFLSRNAVDPRTNSPHTADRISRTIDEAGVNIDNKPMEQQISGVIDKIKPILPIKIRTKKLKLRIPAEHTGRVYGIVTEYKESEEWLSNGELVVVINIPVGLQESFYDKLNSITHGSAISQEIKEA
ncbi:hypothetical protein A3K73_07555, partial [Candidatus Pacearchaeota archaeon RBG_13_36_9]